MTAGTIELDLPIVLPGTFASDDACVDRLAAELRSRDGVIDAHVRRAGESGTDRVCVHYDPDTLSLASIQQIVGRVGVGLTDRYGHILWPVQGIPHERRARTIAARLQRLDGVVEAASTAAGLVRVEFDRTRTDEAAVRAALGKASVSVVGQPDDATEVPKGGPGEEEHSHAHGRGGILGERTELLFAVLCGGLLAAGWSLERWSAVASWVPLTLFVASYFLGGFYTAREALDNLRLGRFEIDFLMLVAAAGAAFLGEWAEGALLLLLFSLGHALEEYAMGRAQRAITALSELAPATALRRRGGETEEVAVAELEPGDVVVVKPDERLPADGFVVVGSGSVDQSAITGESMPVDKRAVSRADIEIDSDETLEPAHRVFAGTINGATVLEVKVAKRPADGTLARLVRLVTEAETMKSPTQRFTDRFERIFVVMVLMLVVLSLFAWVIVDESASASFYRAMAILVAASPCALAIATPSAVLSGVACAGKRGILIKGGAPLENLGTLTAIAFDKTGTLTEGKPRVTDIVPYGDATRQEVLATAWAVEVMSDHPLAKAIALHAADELTGEQLARAEGFESITGRGIKATLAGEDVYIGKDELFRELGVELPSDLNEVVAELESEGRTTTIIRHGERFVGVLGLMDTPRGTAKTVIQQLRGIGIKRMVLISGDNDRVAGSIARQLGLDEARGDLMPEDKVAAIEALKREGAVAMVGDGVNDAPAMARATVGIAMGAAGSDVALETADVALMADDLAVLPFAVALSRKTSRVIRQNLALSLGVVAFLIPATILGLRIGPAVALHEGSTLLVVANALRLLRYRGPDSPPSSREHPAETAPGVLS